MKAQAEKTSLWGIILMVLFTSMSLISCGGDDEDATGGIVAGSDGVVTTGVARDVTLSSATIYGTIDASFLTNGTAKEIGFSYGLDIDADEEFTSSISSSVIKTVITGTTFSSTLTGLYYGTDYYYKAYVRDINGNKIYGSTHKFTTSKQINLTSGDAVDLGLPSGTKWASHNVGASEPEDIGSYFAWGETSPKSSYNKDNSIAYSIAYPGKLTELIERGITDRNCNLTAAYDAATANWGGEWRMPTHSEALELIENCEFAAAKYHDVSGYVVTGPNKNSIFIPYAGYRKNEDLCAYNNETQRWYSSPYWTATYTGYEDRVWTITQEYYPQLSRNKLSKNSMQVSYHFFYNGCPVRPVRK